MIEVTRAMFMVFLISTGYVTDAEKVGWSFNQITISYFEKTNGNCRNISYEDNVIHVSYNDAVEYCKWSGYKLPTEKEYWKLSTEENLKDVWDWVEEGYAVGGSYLCNQSCKGYEKGQRLLISKNTSNSHIGFCVVK